MRTDHGTIQGGERLWPSECRTRGLACRGALHATLCRRLGDGDVERLQVRLGAVPVMVGSKRCHLRELSAASLVRRHEEATECGGYFIVNGNERLIRLLVVPRRNHVVAISRPTYRNRGPGFTQYATVIRCARPDQSSRSRFICSRVATALDRVEQNSLCRSCCCCAPRGRLLMLSSSTAAAAGHVRLVRV